MAPQQEKYVTSAGIAGVQSKIKNDTKPFFAEVKGYVDDTDISFPGFGLIGMVFLSGAYSQTQDDMRGFMKDVDDVLTSWDGALERIKQVWRAAEDASGPTQVGDPMNPGGTITVPPAQYQ
ncbi:hypothetical protein [Thermomonospora umbrina]|uniref:Excreted virulence factor EspC (Type VII ESX diderm) n=1 Tax=Thermomonospora umbrina TaxID=111806 RepID=A0A3D9SLH2_9ACTN|nr:hypothetical protein [Thermomonospora umbrina]REE96567.1 hypothetical protein DFJ69_2005 [Thermomonospora umbrina]